MTGGTAGTTGGAGGMPAASGDTNGGTAGTPPCVNPACPDAPPATGDACSGCSWPPFSCGWDERAIDGLTYTALCDAGQWFVLLQEDPPAGCCTTDADCALSACSDGCIEPICVGGSCKIAGEGQCWRDDQCAPDGVCSGVVACATHCTAPADCLELDQAGICVPKGEGCCLTDGDCDGGHCVKGVCKLAESSNGCYTSDDCGAAAECLDVSVCACGAICPGSDIEGHCVYMR